MGRRGEAKRNGVKVGAKLLLEEGVALQGEGAGVEFVSGHVHASVRQVDVTIRTRHKSPNSDEIVVAAVVVA